VPDVDIQETIGPEPRVGPATSNHLTRELLDWLTSTLTAVLTTPEVQLHARQKAAFVDALKQADRMWPYAIEEG